MTDVTVDSDRLRLDPVEDAIADIAAGKMVVVVDDEDRENEGDLIFAAELATPELVAFMVRYSSGYICAPLTNADCDRLDLPPMVAQNEDARHTAYTVTVDANTGTTGISAISRCETIQRLANPTTTRHDFTRPGHVVPLRAVEGGVLARDGHTEAAVDLARLAGLRPAGVLCEVVSEEDPTDMARGPELRRFADTHGLTMISIEQLIDYRRRTESQVERLVETRMPTEFGEFDLHGYRHAIDGTEFVALTVGDVSGPDVLVRVHSECLTGDVFASRRCDCGPQLHESMRMVQQAGRGVIIYLRGHEGRGIGLMAKLEAYRLQDLGLDTVDANLEQGLPADAREYSAAGQILRDLGVDTLSLLTNNPTKCAALQGYGAEITGRTSIPVEPNSDNIRYLRTKRDRMGHDLPAVDDWERTHEGADS
ncbi:bifunctional 3,4-dihydroxy-2-butanone-4-phosphate synthase/GTP cyclohydrolase II [Corynebacterium sp.]|uniref:bifunctional 3,4-dihydroxy-2-butanone-4-phosphate synthase/GTP cyclohydrolase II n=1 Tax=Corynebacterium sp. TaxID=1720 RepID=UPI0026DF99B6|nr:bifunctional 3,4-dihydroxy-2-butanone-4-phosphate synthase/GTP cyclohydrolase II [Corynebacterium sp.]MDO5511957.1 bifunctional 3,4-dihydroxy-2-butanone-4-phosphate synthase/GTP cyclohydrolase II [Corynebacterium sp.]